MERIDDCNELILYKWQDGTEDDFEPFYFYETNNFRLSYGRGPLSDKYIVVLEGFTFGSFSFYRETRFNDLRSAKIFACKLIPYVFPEILKENRNNYSNPEGKEKSLEDMNPEDIF